ncbi:MAG: hypothetical protein M3R65_11795 [Gemmatimonadota bacterium]|nr:hypothetical protein [Gemmatimonadota bacterium]
MSLPSKELSEQSLDALITRERTRVVAPLTEWRTLSLSLRQEGLLHDGMVGSRPAAEPGYEPRERGSWVRTTGRWTARIAASAVLVGAGVVAGRGMTIGQSLVNEIHVAMSDSSSGTTLRVGNKPFTSTSDARKTMLRAQTDYERAASFLTATDSSPRIAGDPDAYRDRLVGLDDLTNASLSALKESPQDALLNQFYLSAASAREGTLQQLAHALPADERMVSY